MKPLKIAAILLACASSVWALDDTKENRSREADRYMAATPPQALFADMAEQVSRNLPPDQRETFKAILTKNLDVDAISKAIKESMVTHFTADELKALADFYGSEVGKSAMKKFGIYMADVMPAIQAEMAKAMAKTNRDLPDINKTPSS